LQLYREKALAISLGLFLCLSFHRGGNTLDLIPVIGLWSLVPLALAGWGLWQRRSDWVINPASGALLAALLLLTLHGAIGLLPLSFDHWSAFPGRSAYADVLAAISPYMSSPSISLSMDAPGSMRALWVALAALTVALGVTSLSRRTLRWLLLAVVALAILQALVGLLQLALARPSFLVFGGQTGGRYATGAFINRNHFATLLAMALPILIFRVAGRFHFRVSSRRRSMVEKLWWGFATALVATALLASLSRAGTAAGFAVSALAAFLCATAERTWARRLLFLGVVVIAVGLASVSNLAELVGKFQGIEFNESWAVRKLIASTTVSAALGLFPFGAGLGSYGIAFARFQPEQITGFYEHAHNDYSQLIFETGAVGLVALLLIALGAILTALTLYFHQTASRRDTDAPAIAAFLGSLAFAIHSFFDFPAHIPATALVAVMLFSVAAHRELAATPAWSYLWAVLVKKRSFALPARKKSRRKSGQAHARSGGETVTPPG